MFPCVCPHTHYPQGSEIYPDRQDYAECEHAEAPRIQAFYPEAIQDKGVEANAHGECGQHHFTAGLVKSLVKADAFTSQDDMETDELESHGDRTGQGYPRMSEKLHEYDAQEDVQSLGQPTDIDHELGLLHGIQGLILYARITDGP